MLKRAGTDPGAGVRPEESGELRAVLLSLPAVAIPVAGAFLFPLELNDYEALLWLLALIPAFLLAYARGWRGVATALAMGMALLSVTYAATQTLGRPVPDLLWGVVAFYVGITLGLGWLTERVSKKQFNDAAASIALRDPLTDLPNRRFAEVHLEQEAAAADRGRPLSVVIFDFDHFADFNARHGRAAGDGVLRGFANLLRQATRRMNLAARFGPEEFICVLGSCDEEGALVFAARMQERLRLAESTFSLPTMSAGIATYGPGLVEPAQLLAAAEDALLKAKHAGRDRVRVWGRGEDAEIERHLDIAQQAMVAAQSRLERVKFDLSTSEDRPLGKARVACLAITDPAIRSRLHRWLTDAHFQVTEAPSIQGAVQTLNVDHDVIFLDIDNSSTALVDLLQEVRSRFPSTRMVGVLQPLDGRAIPAELLTIRVDAYLIASAEPKSFNPQLAELLRERDRTRASQMQQLQLTDEVRAKEREAKVALAASEARYSSVIQTIQQVIFTTDPDGKWTFLNSAWTTITGHPVESSLGHPIWEYIHADDREGVRDSFARLVSGANSYYRHEVRWRTRTDVYRWLESRFQVETSLDGTVRGATGILTDVTDRRRAEDALRRSEEYFRALIENSEDMMAVVNIDESVRYVSPAVGRVLGYPAESWAKIEGISLVHLEDREIWQSNFAELLHEPGNSRTLELRVRHANGSWRTIEVDMRNQLTVHGVEGIVLNARDVTDRRRTEDALRESEEMLAHAQKMEAIGRLAGGVAHDFNNLLTAIQGHASLLLEQTPDPSTIHSDLQEIKDAATRATALTRQLLAFSRRQVLQPRVVDLNNTVSDMDKLLRRTIGENITLEIVLADELGVVRADPAQIEQVILNLVVNSRDSLERDGRITIRTANRNVEDVVNATSDLPAGPYVMLQVQDNGQGMSAETAEHAFEPFFTTKEAGRGTGLGLSTVYGIVKQSGGHVWLESKPGSGTSVTIYLPRVAVPEQNEPTIEIAAPRVSGGSETILLVEDEPSVRELAKRVLERQGYGVVTAANGAEALQRLDERGRGVDLVLSDVVMPVMDGCDLADRLAVLDPGAKVLLMSGYAQDVVVRQGNMGENRAFIPKPFSPDELLHKVRAVIDGTLD